MLAKASVMSFSIWLPSESTKMTCLRTKVMSQMRWKTPGWLSFSSMSFRKATLSARGTSKGLIAAGAFELVGWTASFSARRMGKVTRSAATRALSKALSYRAGRSLKSEEAENPQAPL